METLIIGRDAMPQTGTPQAPKTFDGDESELEDFLVRFETLANAAELTDEDRIRQIAKYATRKVRKLFEVLKGFDPADWTLFKESLVELYPNAFQALRYTYRDLEIFTAKASRWEISDERDVTQYYRDFYTIAQWLVSREKITTEERNRQFWFGFHPRTRMSLKQRLRILKPQHNMSIPFHYQDVLKAARYLFDNESFYLESERRSGEAKPSWIRSMEEENRRENNEENHDEEEEQMKAPATNRSSSKETAEDLETLVKELIRLKVQDPNYAVQYAKLVLFYPTVADKVVPPAAFQCSAPDNTPMALPSVSYSQPSYSLYLQPESLQHL